MARVGWRRREHPHAHTLDMRGSSPPCAASRRPGRRCGEPPRRMCERQCVRASAQASRRRHTRPAASFGPTARDPGVARAYGVAVDFFNIVMVDSRCWGRDSCCYGLSLRFDFVEAVFFILHRMNLMYAFSVVFFILQACILDADGPDVSVSDVRSDEQND
jgi:hypothetical protein